MVLFPCPSCSTGVTDRFKQPCNRCLAAFEAEYDPIEQIPLHPAPVSIWTALWRLLRGG